MHGWLCATLNVSMPSLLLSGRRCRQGSNRPAGAELSPKTRIAVHLLVQASLRSGSCARCLALMLGQPWSWSRGNQVCWTPVRAVWRRGLG